MAVITNATLQEVAAQIDRRNSILQKFVNEYAPTTWLTVQADVRAGKAKQKYAIGDELVSTYTYDGTVYECPWVVLDNDRECEWEDGTKHSGLWLGMKYVTPEAVQFDAAESTVVDLTEEPNALEGWYYWGVSGSSYTKINVSTGDALPTTYDSIKKCGINNVQVLQSGYNRWSMSAIRQWLNANNTSVGAWWSSTHTGDVAPSELYTLKAFKANLPSDFLSVVTPVKVKTACNIVTDGGATDTTIDMFFLPSLEELYCVPQIDVVEGPYFPYWKRITGLDAPSSSANNGRIFYRLVNHAFSATIRTRSASRSFSYLCSDITGNGSVQNNQNGDVASYPASCAPVCVIS